MGKAERSGWMDRQRSRYASLPAPARRLVGTIASLAPESVRYGKSYRLYAREARMAREDKAQRIEIVHRRFDELWSQLARTEFYGEYIRNRRKHPEDLYSTLAAFPLITREDIRESGRKFCARPIRDLDTVTTGGSSGVPLTVWLDNDRSPKEWAYIRQIFEQSGFRDGDVRAVIRGIQLGSAGETVYEYERGLRELRISPFLLTKKAATDIIKALDRFKVSFIHGYPSALEQLCLLILDEGAHDVRRRVTGVLGSSEPLFQHQRELLARTFPNARVSQFYGLTEKTLLGVETAPDEMYFDPTYGLAELVGEEGETLTASGAVGRVIGTGLLSTGMPLVRYDTGDWAELVEPPDVDNGYLMKVRNIRPRRSQEFVVGRDGQLISIAALNLHSEAYGKLRQFQLMQEVPGIVKFRVEQSKKLDMEIIASVVEEMERKANGVLEIEIDCTTPGSIRTVRGKSSYIDQRLDLTRFRSS